MKILLNALRLSVTVFITQRWDKHVTIHTKTILIIRNGKFFVTKTVKKIVSETIIKIANRTVAERKKRFWSLVILVLKIYAKIKPFFLKKRKKF